MLNILKLKKKNNIPKIKFDYGEYVGAYKHNVPSNKEWFNSIYAFNKNYLKLLLINDNIVFNIIKSYFYMFNKSLENTKTRRKDIRIIRNSGRKTWVSKPEIKHTNDKVIITLFVFNRYYNYFLKNLPKLPLTGGIKKVKYYYELTISLKEQFNILNRMLENRLANFMINKKKYGTRKFLKILRYNISKLLHNKEIGKLYILSVKDRFKLKIKKYDYFNMFKFIKNYYLEDIKNIVTFFNENEKKLEFLSNKIIKNVNNMQPEYIKISNQIINESRVLFTYICKCMYTQKKINLTKTFLAKEMTYMRYKQILLFNKFKFKENFLLPLKRILQKIYKKDIEFNIISLKNYHLSGSILSQIVLSKLKNRKNKPLKVLDNTLKKIRTPILNKRTIKPVDIRYIGVKNIILSNHINKIPNKDILDNFLKTNYINKLPFNTDMDEMVIKNTSNKVISGIFLKVSGRITRRITAERSMYKFREVGTLKNVNSSFKGLSSVTLRGNEKPNVENTFLKSKNIIGSFGLKGWVSSY